jgi:hypothetical protein
MCLACDMIELEGLHEAAANVDEKTAELRSGDIARELGGQYQPSRDPQPHSENHTRARVRGAERFLAPASVTCP